MNALDPIDATRKTGKENFRSGGEDISIGLKEFWSWSYSDLLNNVSRGVLAEFLVAHALGVVKGNTRKEWHPVDLESKTGIKIEVKSAAYIQSWKQKTFSRIEFGIAPTLGWDGQTNKWSSEKKRHSDVYVFCLLGEKIKDKIPDPSDIDQWKFYVISTRKLCEEQGEQKRISLNMLKELKPAKVTFDGLKDAVERAGEEGSSSG